ncbi:MAG: hypothetical protein WD872_07760 [Pirellulaceae bacterium]
MNGIALVLAISTLGVTYDIQQSEDGKLEYVILIEPELLRSLAEGQQIHSDVPPEAGQVERVLIRVGTAAPKRNQTHLAEFRRLLVAGTRWASSDPARAAPDVPPTILWPAKTKPELNYNVSYGWQPDEAGNLAYYVQLNPALLQTLAVGDEIRAAIDPAAGRVGRFVVLSADKSLPKIPAPPPVPASTQLTARGGNRRGFDSAPPAAAPPHYGQSPAADPRSTPLSSTPDLGATTAGVDQPLYSPRAGSRFNGGESDRFANDQRGQATAPLPNNNYPPGYAPQPPAYDSQFDRARAMIDAPQAVDYGPQPGYVARTGAEQPQLPPRNGYAPQVNYAPQPALDERLASANRTSPIGNMPLPAPQLNANGTKQLPADGAQPEKPWMPLMLTFFALSLSIGANLYLGWTAAEFYSRYRLATERLRSAGRT